MLGFNGGLLGVRKVPTTGSASGLWMPNEQSVAKRAGIWPPSNNPVYSQSSLYSGVTAASLANMTNGSYIDTATATDPGGTQWVKVDYGQLVQISAAVVGTATGNIPGGWSKTYTEGKDVQVSTDNSTWTTVFNTGSFAAEGIYTFYFAPVQAQYMRIAATSGGYLAVSEFYAL